MVEHTGTKIIIEDLSGRLPTKGAWPTRSSAIRSLTLHHTGGGTSLEGLSAVINTAKFSIRRDDPSTDELEGRSWPAIPYHYFVPFTPEVRNARLVIYRCLPEEAHSNHTGAGWNSESLAVCFQGHFGSGHTYSRRAPSAWQQIAWEELAEYLVARHGLDGAYAMVPHCWAGTSAKAACPGSEIASWVRRERNRDPQSIRTDFELCRALAVVLERPALLEKPEDDHALQQAVRVFQRSCKVRRRDGVKVAALQVDGVAGPATEFWLRRALRDRVA